MERTVLLVALDGSNHAAAAIPYAKSLAASIGLSIRFLSVVERDTPRSNRSLAGCPRMESSKPRSCAASRRSP